MVRAKFTFFFLGSDIVRVSSFFIFSIFDFFSLGLADFDIAFLRNEAVVVPDVFGVVFVMDGGSNPGKPH